MSALVRLAAVLPRDSEVNGIDHIAQSLVSDPDRLRYAVVAFRTREIKTVVESGIKVPTIEIERVEYVGDPNSVDETIIDAFMAAAQDRTGHEPLPFDETDPSGVTVTPADERDDPFFPDEDEDADQ